MSPAQLSSEFLHYLASHRLQNGRASEGPGEAARLPSLAELSKEIGVSVAALREQVEVAKAIGLIEVRPRTGMRRLDYSFLPAVRQSLSYAIAVDLDYFFAYSDLRNHIEATYWHEAVCKLTLEDHQRLGALVASAWEKLRGRPIQIPHREHRLLHTTIYSRLGNLFVQGLLDAYWEAYEAVGLNLYADYDYLQQVWNYHQRMVDAICAGDFEQGYQALVEHRDMLHHHPSLIPPPDPSA